MWRQRSRSSERAFTSHKSARYSVSELRCMHSHTHSTAQEEVWQDVYAHDRRSSLYCSCDLFDSFSLSSGLKCGDTQARRVIISLVSLSLIHFVLILIVFLLNVAALSFLVCLLRPVKNFVSSSTSCEESYTSSSLTSPSTFHLSASWSGCFVLSRTLSARRLPLRKT